MNQDRMLVFIHNQHQLDMLVRYARELNFEVGLCDLNFANVSFVVVNFDLERVISFALKGTASGMKPIQHQCWEVATKRLKDMLTHRDVKKEPQKRETTRCTGRTERMLEHAHELLQAGKFVYIVATNHAQCKMFAQEFLDIDEDQRKRLRIETPESAGTHFDWHTMRPAGWGRYVVLVDDSTIEQRFGMLLSMLHAYDE